MSTTEDTFDGLHLVVLMIYAPWRARDPEDPSTIHAATMDGVAAGWPEGPILAPCGAEVRIITSRDDAGKLVGYKWPPRVALLREGVRRCLACHKATGSKRPAS